MAAGSGIQLQPGYRSGGGHFFPVKDNSGATLSLPGSATIKADAKFDTYYNDNGQNGVGIYLDMSTSGLMSSPIGWCTLRISPTSFTNR